MNLLVMLATIGAVGWAALVFITDWRTRRMQVPAYIPTGGRVRSALRPRGVTSRGKTSIFLVAVIVAMLAWEAFAIFVIGPGATISEVYWNARQHFPLDLLVGILLGHLTWQRKGTTEAILARR